MNDINYNIQHNIYYMLTDADNIVKDLIRYPFGDYVQVTITGELPENYMAGYYRWIDDTFVFDQALYDAIMNPEPTEAEDMQAALEALGVEPVLDEI